MIPQPPVSPKPAAPSTPLWRKLVRTGVATAFAVFAILLSTWGWRQHECSLAACKPDTSLLGPLVGAGPLAWLIAAAVVGVIAIVIHIGIRWWRSNR